MGMGTLSLGDGAGQCIGICRLHDGEAVLPMLVGKDLDLVANQGAVHIEAVLRVAVQDNFFLAANRLRVCGGVFRQLLFPANQHIGHAVAFVRMLMVALDAADQFSGQLIACLAMLVAVGFLLAAGELRMLGITFGAVVVAGAFFQAAHQIAAFIPAGFAVLVAIAFRLAADKALRHGQAAVVVPVAGSFLLAADEDFFLRPAGIAMLVQRAGQLVSLLGIAAFIMNMRCRCIAGFIMPVLLDRGERTPEIAVVIIAGGIMDMDHVIGIAAGQHIVCAVAGGSVPVKLQCFCGTDRNPLRLRQNLRIAGIGMGMLRQRTSPLHGDGRKDQGIGRAEYHDGAENHHHLMPTLLKPMLSYVLLPIGKCIAFHRRSPPISMHRSRPKARL